MRRGTVRVGTGDAVLFATTWLGQDGVSGLGVAAHEDDESGLDAAEQLVETWSAVLRTRRVLIAATTPEDSPLATALVRVREFAARGDTVILIGRRAAPLTGVATVLVSRVEDVATVDGVDPERLSFVVLPGIPVEDAAVILAALRRRFPRLRGQHPDEFCYAASDRREALRSVASASDLLLVCGWTEDVPHTHGQVRELSDVGRLRAHWLVQAATVGIAPGDPALVDEVIEVLRGLGPLSVVRRRVTTEVTHRREAVTRLRAHSSNARATGTR
ncbi:hypothetical protein Lesp02_22860 [Lentzea sp. NBRC 105346]|nr:hypothetical protein Lesp02_22860 [Lentzea sp. NBRC 105346]